MPNSHTIKIHGDGHCTPKHQHANRGDEILWECDHHSWTIDFVRDSPLPQSHYEGNAGATVNAGAIEDKATIKDPFKYTVTVQKARQATSVDPDIIVDA
jgi:hypothetical protein